MRDYWARLEDQRKMALENGDCLKYYQICNQLGVEPEIQDMYERGNLDAVMECKRNGIFLRYQTFYDKGEKLSTSFERDTKEKKANLRNFFKGKRRNGLEDMDDLTIGALHQKILTYSEKRISSGRIAL